MVSPLAKSPTVAHPRDVRISVSRHRRLPPPAAPPYMAMSAEVDRNVSCTPFWGFRLRLCAVTVVVRQVNIYVWQAVVIDVLLLRLIQSVELCQYGD